MRIENFDEYRSAQPDPESVPTLWRYSVCAAWVRLPHGVRKRASALGNVRLSE
jgi:hypothetical protein